MAKPAIRFMTLTPDYTGVLSGYTKSSDLGRFLRSIGYKIGENLDHALMHIVELEPKLGASVILHPNEQEVPPNPASYVYNTLLYRGDEISKFGPERRIGGAERQLVNALKQYLDLSSESAHSSPYLLVSYHQAINRVYSIADKLSIRLDRIHKSPSL